MNYSVSQWFCLFYFYCFLGWCFESTYVSLKKKRFVNRGFLHGPFLPIYGSGAVFLLAISEPFKKHIVLMFFVGLTGATVLEYITGAVMEALFKVRYWDYSNQKIQYHGYICLSSSLAWGVLAVVMTDVIQPPIDRILFRIPKTAVIVAAFLIGAILLADFIVSFKKAMDLRSVLIRLEKGKEELARLRKRLEELAGQEIAKLEELARQELTKLEEEYREQVEKHRLLRQKLELGLGIVRRNPGMSSVRFKESVEELKSSLRHSDKGGTQERETAESEGNDRNR